MIHGASIFQGDAVFHSAAHLQGEGAVRAWSEDEKFNKHEMMLNKVILLRSYHGNHFTQIGCHIKLSF